MTTHNLRLVPITGEPPGLFYRGECDCDWTSAEYFSPDGRPTGEGPRIQHERHLATLGISPMPYPDLTTEVSLPEEPIQPIGEPPVSTDTTETTGTDFLISGVTHAALGEQVDLPEPTVKHKGRGSTVTYPGLTDEQVEALKGRLETLATENKSVAGPARWDIKRNTVAE